MGLVPGALSKASSSKDRSLVASSSSTSASALAAAEDLYRDANTLAYGDNKPSEDAIDRVVSKMNLEYVTVDRSSTLKNTQSNHSVYPLASTRKVSSLAGERTKTMETLHTSTSTTRCSTRRFVPFRVHMDATNPMTDIRVFFRSPDITTSTLKKLEIVSSVARPSDSFPYLILCSWLSCSPVCTICVALIASSTPRIRSLPHSFDWDPEQLNQIILLLSSPPGRLKEPMGHLD